MFLLHRIVTFFFVTCTVALLYQPANAQHSYNKLLASNFNAFKSAPPANSFELDGIDNVVVNPAMMKDKVIILNFWKIDCAACSMEKPLLEKLARRYSDRGLEVIAVNLFDAPSDISEYVKNTDFPFTYCFDSHQRYTVNQKRLPSGIPTTFVVNSDLEAIYEIQGLPTTYVIDRSGRVVGYSVGLVNWDDGVLTSYIESLLGPQVTTVALAADVPFSADARQGTNTPSGPTRAGPTKKKNPEPSTLSTPEAPAIPSSASIPTSGPTLPFQSTDRLRGDQGHDERPESQSQEYIDVKPQKPAKEKSKARPKTEKSQSSKSATEYAKPKPFSPGSQTGAAPSDYPVYSNTTSTAKQPGVLTGSEANTNRNLPPLPAAMPYSPPNRREPSAPVNPDETGSVVARVPGAQSSHVGGASGNLPAAQPLGPGNTIGVSIMDSFSKPGAAGSSSQNKEVQQQNITPPSTILGQFSQDIQNLGAGIRDTFGSLIPK